MSMTAESRKVGYLAVKPEYILPPEPVEEPGPGDEGLTAKKRKRGQNTNRKRPGFRESLTLCLNHVKGSCPFAEQCKYSHSIKDYLAQKEEDISNVCPVFEAIGKCTDGWRCRWLSGHLAKVDTDEEGSVDGLKLIANERKATTIPHEELNRISQEQLALLRQETFPTPFSDKYLLKLEEEEKGIGVVANGAGEGDEDGLGEPRKDVEMVLTEDLVAPNGPDHDLRDFRATFVESPLRPSEKRRINWSGLRVLAPLTTVGNPPFRRLASYFGAQLTYSEMALSPTLLHGQKQEWALARAHPSETHRHSGPPNSYYGIQIAGGKIPAVVKTAEILATVCTEGLDTIDLNCGCPLDMVFKMGAGSALLDSRGKLMKMLRGMVTVTGDVPVTCKIRMGVNNGKATAGHLVRRLVAENVGVSAVTLHGRSRAQRYSKAADWAYIAECAAIIKRAKEDMADATDASYQNLEHEESQRMAFIGNGDVNSYADFYQAIEKSGCDTSMIARAAIIKPWIFEEIQQRQHIDKSASERLDMLKQFAHWGLEHWGSDAVGVSTTRRFFCEFMSFFHRYVPLGILEHEAIPPHLHDWAPKWRGRSDLETLLGSTDSRDWVRVSEMFLGKCPDGWHFTPKHKSNSVDAEG